MDNKKTRKIDYGWIMILLLGCFLMFFVMAKVSGQSMDPTLQEGDLLFTQKHLLNIERGDIVVFRTPDIDRLLIKRVIGLPGDSIVIKDGTVEVNGVQIDEPYILEDFTSGYFEGVIPDNNYFVMGDNRQNSLDSRESIVGTVSRDRIIAKVLFRINPNFRFF